MSRSQRIDSPGLLHHVTARVNWRAWLLDDDRDKHDLARLIRETAEELGVDVFACVLMSNHVHLVVRSPPTALYAQLTSRRMNNRHYRPFPRGHQKSTVIAQFMRSIRHRTSLRRQRELELSGRFWEGKYDARRIEDAKSLIIRIAYDHRNPVKANMAIRPDDYRWSTAAAWVSGEPESLPILIRQPLPFGLTRAVLRSEIVRYQDDRRLDGMGDGLKELFSLPGPIPDDVWRELFTEHGVEL